MRPYDPPVPFSGYFRLYRAYFPTVSSFLRLHERGCQDRYVFYFSDSFELMKTPPLVITLMLYYITKGGDSRDTFSFSLFYKILTKILSVSDPSDAQRTPSDFLLL